MKTALVSAALLSPLLLTGCDRSPSLAAPAPEPSTTSDSGGGFGPTIGLNGKVGMGYDTGSGIIISPSGNLSFGLGL